MLDQLRQDVLDANLELVRGGLVLQTFGNASAISRADRLVVIKPSGVAYERLSADDMVLTDLDGNIVEGKLRPSVDLTTHLVLYKAFPGISAVVHTHSEFATVWAQAGQAIPALGTTHADYFAGPVPVTRPLSEAEILGDYVGNTGAVIAECFAGLDPLAIPAVLVDGHGPFCWGRGPAEAVRNALVLETVARMALHTLLLRPATIGISQTLLNRHYVRKHGAAASYGQGVE
jgi:L-ribulose-5-phosphate 4-epimerase